MLTFVLFVSCHAMQFLFVSERSATRNIYWFILLAPSSLSIWQKEYYFEKNAILYDLRLVSSSEEKLILNRENQFLS